MAVDNYLNMRAQQFPRNSNGVIEAFSDGIVTVDKMLDWADMDLDWYIPSEDAIDFILFIRLALGEEPENSNPKAHYFFIDCVFQSPCVKPFFDERGIDFEGLKGRTVVLCTREFAKSVMVVYLVLYMAAKGRVPNFGPVHYGIYVSDSMRNNVKTTMETIGKVYQESKYLRSLFEDVRLTQEEVNFIRKPSTKKEIETFHQHVNVEKESAKTCPGRMKRTLSLSGLGAATGGRGSRDGLARPEFAIFDDMIPNEKDAESETILDNIESTIESDILKALSGNGNFAVAIGTPYKKNDPIYRRIEDRSWLPVVFPRAKYIDENMIEADFQSVWPDRHSYKQCMKDFMTAKKAKDNGNNVPMRKLLQENYLRISSDEDRMIGESMIQWYNRTDIEKRISEYNIYMTTDFTTTGSQGSDLSGIATWAIGSNNDYFLLDLCLRKQELHDQYEEVFRQNKYFGMKSGRVNTVGVETDGQQKAHIFSLKQSMVKKNEWFTLGKQKGAKTGSEGIVSRLEGGNKHWRFKMMLPLFQNKKLWFPNELKTTPDMMELMEEIKYCTYSGFGSKHDDGIDLISMLGAMDIIFPMPGMGDFYGEMSKKKTNSKRGGIYYRESDESESETAYDSYS